MPVGHARPPQRQQPAEHHEGNKKPVHDKHQVGKNAVGHWNIRMERKGTTGRPAQTFRSRSSLASSGAVISDTPCALAYFQALSDTSPRAM
ncbi:hypothetical protein D3C73_1223250 [compost metagenome]